MAFSSLKLKSAVLNVMRPFFMEQLCIMRNYNNYYPKADSILLFLLASLKKSETAGARPNKK